MTDLLESFEDASVPACWRTAGGGSLRPSARHYKDGAQSLHWTWADGSRVRRTGLALSTRTHPQAGMQGWVYSERPLAGRLTFRLGSAADVEAGAPAFVFRFGLNFTGWRMFQVQFEADARQTPDAGSGIEVLEIAPPESAASGAVFLDAFVFSDAMSAQRSADYQIPEYSGGLGGWCQHWPLFYSQQTPSLPLPAEVTDAQRRDFALISSRYFRWLLGRPPSSDAALLRRAEEETEEYIRRGWEAFRGHGVRVADDGTITGPGLVRGRGEGSFYHVFYDMLLPLAFDFRLHANAEAAEAALLLFDYVHDQGWADGSALGSLWLNCLMFAPYCHAIALLRDELHRTGRLERAVRAAFWYQTFGKSFSRFDEGYTETNADALRSIVFTAMIMVLTMDDTPQKVQYMRGWLAWINSALEISPRFTGLVKPDGLGFHHHGVYAGAYTTCAYEFCALAAWLLHGTQFALAPRSIENLKLALRTQDALSNKYDVPYTTMGRMPHPGVRILSAYAYLALASDPPDREMAGIFMRLWDPDCEALAPALRVTLDSTGGQFLCIQTPGRPGIMQELADMGIPASPPSEGFRVMPWGALAVHRRADWLVSVKGWSQYVWDFERHPKSWAAVEENVFARYWSYGTLQPITHGEPRNPVDSGWNLDRGWDWTRWPGATTPHLGLAELYDPATSWECRFFSSETFVGGVSSGGRGGMFALKLHEHYYDPTFRAIKTYCFFDNEIICLGSNIESRDAGHPVETTLFQCWMPDPDRPVEVNGQAAAAFPWEYRAEGGRPATIADPLGNGYFLPDGRGLRLTRSEQRSRDAWNRGETSGAYSTCWIDHGPAPREDGYGGVRYHYVMLVRTTPGALAAYAAAPPYRVLMQNHQAHIVEHLPQRTMAYALFEADWIIPHGLLRRTDTPVLAAVREEDGGILLSLADPDLGLPKRRNMGYLDDEANATPSRSSVVRIELRGDWAQREPVPDVLPARPSAGKTLLEFRCRDALTREIRLVRRG